MGKIEGSTHQKSQQTPKLIRHFEVKT